MSTTVFVELDHEAICNNLDCQNRYWAANQKIMLFVSYKKVWLNGASLQSCNQFDYGII